VFDALRRDRGVKCEKAADVTEHLARAAADVVVEQNVDLRGWKDAHETHEMTVIKAVVEQARYQRASRIEIAVDVLGHLTASICMQ
jgi:hypothetical protein